MLLARQHLFISLVSAQTESGWNNLGMLLARQHLFISLVSVQIESGRMIYFVGFCTDVLALLVAETKLYAKNTHCLY